MKKTGIICNFILCISIILALLIFAGAEKTKEEFEIFQIYTVQGGDYRKTSMNVIVNVEESDELLIRLFNGRKAFKEHKCAGEKEYKGNTKSQ